MNEFNLDILLDIDVSKAKVDETALDCSQLELERITLNELDEINWDLVASSLMGILDPIGQLAQWLAGTLSSFYDLIKKAFESIAKTIYDKLLEVWEIITKIPSYFSSVLDAINKVIVTPIQDLIKWISDNLPKLSETISLALSKAVETITKLPDYIKSFVDSIAKYFSDFIDRIKDGFAWIFDQISKIRDFISDLLSGIISLFSDLAGRIKEGFSWLIDQLSKIPSILDSLIKDLSSRILSAFSEISKGLSALADLISKMPGVVKASLESIIGDVVKGVGGVTEWVRKGFESLATAFEDWFTKARDWFTEATRILKELGATFTGFVNAILLLPDRLKVVFEGFVKFFENLWISLQEFLKDPSSWLKKNLVEPLFKLGSTILEGLKTVWNVIYSALSWLWERIYSGVMWLKDKLIDVFKSLIEMIIKTAEGIKSWLEGIIGKWFKETEKDSKVYAFDPIIATSQEVERTFQYAIKRVGGVAENLWLLSGSLMLPYWKVTLIPLMLRGLVRTFGDLTITIEPGIVGSKIGGASYQIKLSEFVDAVVKGFEVYYTGYAMGVSMAIANMFVVNLQQLYTPRVISYYDLRIKNILGDILKDEFEAGAKVNMFLKPVSETALIDYARRMLSLSEGIKDEKKLKEILSTVKAHLKIYGLPKWYIDYLTSHPEQLAVSFMDRFGAERKVYLSHIFELPTHSELARMTQRDIFPGVDVMKRVAWIRGWNEDLTTLMYLLTFKYPSFEKLWTFYMRALSGMLWFKAPETIKKVFDKEAEEVKAGYPISPLDLQKALTGTDQVKAFETALNVYFKWLEYSNFSWFTDKTSMYGVNVGAEVIGKLGGWTSDSWLMIDVSADIPTKIDMRWMSRFGIFLHMAEKFEKLGVKFESYAPLVEVVPKLMETSPASEVKVDLTWSSKLLQATGLHLAWVPITTVAENIMVIADEMTLLRTGWLNLFKEGMITVEDAEKSLAGLIVASYLVGYWNPETKTWTSGWINLPVRWLPHERRLLELRMAMDRVLDIYREIYSYIRSGIRTLSITVDEAKSKLQTLIKALGDHYKSLTKAITGMEMELRLDEGYATMWLMLQALAQDIEAKERIRVWWSRVSGWLLYRLAYGWVTDVEVEGLIDTIKKYVPLPKVEEEAYKNIAKAVLGIVKKEAIPSPSQLATFAEYMVLPATIIAKVLKEHNVPDEYWPLWITYISVKPIKSDYKAVITTALRALRYNAITYEQWKAILENATRLGFTPTEVDLLQLRADLELAIENAREYVPTPSQLATLAEYIPEVRAYITQVFEARRVKGVWAEMWTKYIYLRPTIDEVRRWANAMFGLTEYFIIDVEQLKQVFAILKTYGYEDLEITIIQKTIDATRVRRAFLDVLGAPRTIVGMARYAEKATDLAVSRAFKMIEALPVDDNTKKLLKEMWRQYVMSYQAYPEIRSYETELINSYAYGALDDKGLDQELDYLRKLGVPELRLALVKRTAQLRRARRALTAS
jgi:predicted PurR-regulated permease PerM